MVAAGVFEWRFESDFFERRPLGLSRSEEEREELERRREKRPPDFLCVESWDARWCVVAGGGGGSFDLLPKRPIVYEVGGEIWQGWSGLKVASSDMIGMLVLAQGECCQYFRLQVREIKMLWDQHEYMHRSITLARV